MRTSWLSCEKWVCKELHLFIGYILHLEFLLDVLLASTQIKLMLSPILV